MEKIDIKNLKVGDKFDQPLLTDAYNVLLEADAPLQKTDIEKLKQWAILEVYTFGSPLKPIEEMSEDEIKSTIENAALPQETTPVSSAREISIEAIKKEYQTFQERRKIFESHIIQTTHELGKCYQYLIAKKPINSDNIVMCANKLTDEILNTPLQTIPLIYKNFSANHTIHHLLHTAAYGISLARALKMKKSTIEKFV